MTAYRHVSDEDLLAAMVAALVHDFEHPGVNNAFHVALLSDLAILYNDRHVLEQHHCASAFSIILNNDSCNIFKNFRIDTYRRVREMIVTLVFATDMAKHFEYVGKFQAKLNVGFNLDDRQDIVLLFEMAMKCADISNPLRPRDISYQWATLLMEEFFNQGDEEKNNDLPVSQFMDRDHPNLPKCQIGFINFIIVPMFELWAKFIGDREGVPPESLEFMVTLRTNVKLWTAQLE